MANASYVGTRWAFKSKSADTFRIIHQTGNNATPTPPGDTMLTLIPWHGGQPFAIPLAVLSEYYFPVRHIDPTIPGGSIDDHNETAD